MITSSLNRNEHKALSDALKKYFRENETNTKVISKQRDLLISKLKDKLLELYCNSPKIKESASDFDFSAENLSHALDPKPDGEERKKVCPKAKARFLIWALEYEGYYNRPKYMSNDHLYDSFTSYIYKGKAEEYQVKDYSKLEGVYLVKRLSFNNSFPGWVTVSRMWVWFDLEKKILRYQTINKYDQLVNGKTLNRERVTKGYIFKFQGNILFFGDVDYSHLSETEDNTSHYPEILLVHSHGGDVKNIRGLTLGNYPFLNLPVATSILISKELSLDSSEESVKSNLDSYIKNKKSRTDELIGLKELSDLREQKDYILNSIEEKYSKMLTP